MPTAAPLSPQRSQQFRADALSAAAFLRLDLAMASPEEVLGAIDAFLAGPHRPVSEGLGLALGVLVGEQFLTERDWSWVDVRWEDGDTAHCISPPDGHIAIAPIHWVRALAATDSPPSLVEAWRRWRDDDSLEGLPEGVFTRL